MGTKIAILGLSSNEQVALLRVLPILEHGIVVRYHGHGSLLNSTDTTLRVYDGNLILKSESVFRV
jgi:hypothetical protein